MQKVSVIICTRNRPKHLQRCVASLFRQTVKPKEIIIVDDASDEKIDVTNMLSYIFSSTRNTASSLSLSNIEIKYMKNKSRFGVVKSRNLGIASARSDIIAFIDDDGYAHRNWIKNLMKHYQAKNVAGVGGPVVEVGRHVETKNEVKRLSYITRYGDIKHNYRVKKLSEAKKLRCGNVRFLMGGNMSFRRDALLKAHGFNVQYKGNYYREETDACMRISKLGKIVFDPSVLTYHNTAKQGGTRNVMHLEKFIYWYLRNTVLLFFRHFSFKNAVMKTWHQLNKNISAFRKGTIRTNRDYLVISTSFRVLLAILTGAFAGLFVGIVFDRPLKKLMYKHPEYAILITVALIGTTFEITDHRVMENIVSRFEKL